ncbi:hypothetical protein GCM10011376_00910 [Nocardioides flavus (ex Wang et al. 2016)]|uniref:Methyltransferase type 11 domain-containing protein n=1 Tax=Nocardioides flavus (ex Wang et al. 2016) TaxID=2058780 RepID=A0ABQ3HFA7_9ACTN|nr:hypothetical protein GCM10011376_00910 [Nocardioides flavus (ex Wang et al. 2016)]
MTAEFSQRTLEVFLQRPKVSIELGCGPAKRDPQALGVDVLDLPGVDLVSDAQTFLQSLPDGSVDSIYSEHFLEHVPNAYALVAESSRVLKAGGQFRAVIPHFSNPWFYSDPTHSTHFGLYTFAYWVESHPFSRGVPHYSTPLPFHVESANHIFKSNRPFLLRHALKKTLGSWVNTSRWTQEFYEEHLTWIMPCYEIDYRLTRL